MRLKMGQHDMEYMQFDIYEIENGPARYILDSTRLICFNIIAVY